jgi:hypothetical protein
MTNEQTDWRALCADLVQLDKEQPTEYLNWKKRWDAAVSRVSTTLAQPEPEGPTDEQWDAIKDRLWSRYETVGYQGERFMYQGDFDTALDVARQDLTRWGRPTIKPVPVSERLPGPEDCAPWPDDPNISWCWYAREHEEGGWRWRQDSLCNPRAYGYTHWLPHHALPLPQQPS